MPLTSTRTPDCDARRAEILERRRRVVDDQRPDVEALQAGVEVRDHAGHLDFGLARAGLFDARRARRAARGCEAVHLDHVADGDSRQRSRRDRIVEHRLVVDGDHLPGDRQRARDGVDCLHGTLDQVILRDRFRAGDALRIDLGRQVNDFTDPELARRGRLVLDADLRRVRVVTHAIDDDAAEAGDRTGDERGLGRTGRRRRVRGRAAVGRTSATAAAGDQQGHRRHLQEIPLH